MVFLNLIKVSGTYRVDFAIEYPMNVLYKHFSFTCFVFHGASCTPTVHVNVVHVGGVECLHFSA